MKSGLAFLIIVIAVVGAWFGFRTGSNTENITVEENNKKEEQQVAVTALALEGDAKYQVDNEKSTLAWHASKITGTNHDGTFSVLEGVLSQVNGELTSGEFVVDMNSITDNDGSDALITHLKSADFFNVETYPTAKIKISNIIKQEGGYRAKGQLTILDKTNEVEFPVAFSSQEENITAKATFDIDRTKWGIEYGSGSVFKNLGDKAIKDEITFDLDLVFTPKN